MNRLLAALLLAPAPIVSAAHAETLEDAMTEAFLTNPNLEDARFAVRAAREGSVQARAGYLPTLSFIGSYGVRQVETETVGFFGPTTTQSDLDPLQSSVQLQQPLYTGGRLSGQTRLARAGVESARHGLRGVEMDVLLAVVDVYLNVRRDEDIVRLRREHVDNLTRQVIGTRRRLDVGEVSRTDLAQAQTRLAGAQGALARAEADLATSRARYELIVGRAPENLAPVEAPEAPPRLDTAIGWAEERHPDILRARAARRAALAQVSIERSALMPQVTIQGRYDYNENTNIENDRSEGAAAVAQVALPLYEGGYSRSRTRQRRIDVQRAEAGVEARRREVVANVVAAWSNLEAGRDIVAAARDQVEAADLAVQGAERERGLGLRTTLDVLNAEEERRNALIALARAEADALFAGYALLSATGGLTLETMGIKE